MEPLRLQYIYSQYSTNFDITPVEFLDKVKEAYYRFDSEDYSLPQLDRALKTLKLSKENQKHFSNIIDIGAGTGAIYQIINELNINYESYVFIEPFKSMSDQLKVTDKKLSIINDYFTNVKIPTRKSSNVPNLFIFSGVFRTLHNPLVVLEIIKKNMKTDDLCLFVVEPNNKYFKTIHNFIYPLDLLVRIKNKVKIMFRKQDLKLKNLTSKENNSHIDPLEKAVNYLIEEKVVNTTFNRKILYAMVYYNNLLLWKYISIPKNMNEGFFTFDIVKNELGCEEVFFKTDTFFYGHNWLRLLDKLIIKVCPKSGAAASVLLKKT